MARCEDSTARRTIDRAMRRGRLANSILLSGRSQEALEELAYEVAGRLLGLGPGDNSQSIVEYPDLFALRPSKRARQISADDTRELIRRIQHSPILGSNKVAVIFEADRFNLASANIFLKTLEEPPFNTTIILLTTRPYSLLPTIRSRCLNIRVSDEISRDTDPETDEWLQRYRDWLNSLTAGLPPKEDVPNLILGIYALVAEFKTNLDRITKKSLGDRLEMKRDTLSDEEKTAIESSVAVSVRDRLLFRMEEITAEFARSQANSGNDSMAARLPAAIDALEEVARLLRVNYQVQYAVEQFLLASLRIWTASKA
jgi:DNA polymerase-3 subunit delta'